MLSGAGHKVKTTMVLEKALLQEIDQYNPFPTRKEFVDQACKAYLQELRRRRIDEDLAKACSEAAVEDATLNEEWELVTLETWK